ncbi:unnamed protein product [Danaus chrysippus]|uniref:Elongation of very long chain fatty acids protein n=1 Tax=Danaus chrysippus TaxID=151541 RepID=A0A8J2QD80_9NEOP|nr:unnamed protein product [Danaus chrysippus]
MPLRFPDWDLNKSLYGEVDSLPLMATPGPVLMILALYLLYVLKIGPALMTKREPYKLTTALLLYNGLQVVGSVYLVQMIQFVCIIIHYIIAVRTSDCPPSKGVATFVASNTVFFLILFLNFYSQRYLKKSLDQENISDKSYKMK